MSSNRRHNTSKSGASQKSTKKPARLAATGNFSSTAPASFDQVFGKGLTEEQKRYQDLMAAAEDRLQKLLLEPMPANALLRTRHKQKIASQRRQIRSLAELLD